MSTLKIVSISLAAFAALTAICGVFAGAIIFLEGNAIVGLVVLGSSLLSALILYALAEITAALHQILQHAATTSEVKAVDMKVRAVYIELKKLDSTDN